MAQVPLLEPAACVPHLIHMGMAGMADRVRQSPDDRACFGAGYDACKTSNSFPFCRAENCQPLCNGYTGLHWETTSAQKEPLAS